MSRSVRLLTISLVIVVMLVATQPVAQAQYPLAKSSTVLTFDGYHDYKASLEFMDHYVRTYPEICESFSIGSSYLGTEVKGVIITNRATGPHTDKSAYWADGNRHAGEVTGAEAVLYTIKYLCENYGTDPVVTGIVDNKVAYLVPKMNPDGADLHLNSPESLRSTVRPYDSDNDGLMDEDPAEDLDGDGYSRQMRWQDPEGQYVLDDSAANGMRQRTENDTGPFYNMGSEGIDNDKDGRYNEDGTGGLDLHRNFPFNWRPMSEDDATGRGRTQGGAGEYPLSEPEVRNIVVYLLQHPNINTVETYDTTVPMLLRPPSMGDDRLMYPEDEAC
ncbi:M14 family metallopeptidase [Gemmatimonadota bacterium]